MPRRKSTSPRARRAPPAAVTDAFSRLKSLVRPRKPSGGEVSDADAAQIERDVGRSGAADQAQLRRVLRACCARAGYCQGINLLAARVLNSGVETATATDMLVQLREELPSLAGDGDDAAAVRSFGARRLYAMLNHSVRPCELTAPRMPPAEQPPSRG